MLYFDFVKRRYSKRCRILCKKGFSEEVASFSEPLQALNTAISPAIINILFIYYKIKPIFTGLKDNK